MIETRPPGLTVTLAERPQAPNRLRTDVAALVGRTRRGPVLAPLRVQGWADFRRAFGGLVAGALTPYAARGYFENGGEAAYVVRVEHAAEEAGEAGQSAGHIGGMPDVFERRHRVADDGQVVVARDLAFRLAHSE